MIRERGVWLVLLFLIARPSWAIDVPPHVSVACSLFECSGSSGSRL